ncbi:MAG TPA: dihydrolipoamide acetyltransferase family protein [Vicinamibacterales bacterium]|nr:dihydrolipoamide acetyltransferase family protein [Vicinamibacterales bacterium]
MPKTVVMPQMGESVAEGTIVRWLKKVGDQVERDEPLFEISTDKVDAEIPSPGAGVLSAINVQEGATVPINTVVGVIDDAGAAAAAPPARGAAAPAPAPGVSAAAVSASASAPSATADKPADKPGPPVAPAFAPSDATAGKPSSRPWSVAESRELRLSPVVKKIAREHHVDVRNIAGSGEGGRVTKGDILAYIDAGAPVSAPQNGGSAFAASASASAGQTVPLLGPNPAAIAGLDADKYERQPMTVMRRKIAEHMVMSKRTSPHVHSAFEIDFTKVDEIRKAKKAEYEQAGGKLTYMSFITKACASALKAVPVVNASVDGTDIVLKKVINIGVAVALEGGLIVPVVKNADAMSLLEISKAIADLAARAREKKLKPEEVQGGTFTITNPGVFGALFGMPIISQPQVAIVGVGAVEKRPVVIDDAVAIRLRAYLTIGYDHRIIDGAIADEFMQHVKKMIETWDE